MKKILINFDGTGNEPGDAEEKKKDGVAKDENISNVLKIHLLAGGNIENDYDPGQEQISLYYPGVGVRGNIFRRLWRTLVASKAPEEIMEEAFDDLNELYTQGDSLFIFGFSRGAAIARLFASRLAKNGLLAANGTRDMDPVVKFLGVFDTVASFGKPNLDRDTRPVSDVVFENDSISPIIETAYHLVSLDENRLAFRPTLMNHEDRVNEIWFPGVHSDVGGGYAKDGLSDISLKYMLEKAEDHGLTFFDNASEIPAANLVGRDHEGENVTIEVSDVAIKPNIRGKIHHHKQRWRDLINTLAPRDACVIEDDKPTSIPYKVHISVQQKIQAAAGLRKPYNPVPLLDENEDFTFVQ